MSEIDQFAREVNYRDLADVREKSWKIFSWSSSILTLMIGGILALTTQTSFAIEDALPWVMSVSVIVVTLYSILWIRQNLRFESEILAIVRRYDKKLSIESYDRVSKIKFGYNLTILFLGAAAILCIWLDGLATHADESTKSNKAVEATAKAAPHF